MNKPEPIIGVWTPWAEALCRHCHDAIEGMTRKKTIDWPSEKPDGYAEGFCTKCGCSIWVCDDVAQLTRLRVRVGGDLQQTGGMCSALTIQKTDGSEGTVVITNLDGPIDIGVYKKGAWEETGQCDEQYRIPGGTLDRIAAEIIRTVLEGVL